MKAQNLKQATRRFVPIIILCVGLFAAQQSFAQSTLPVQSADDGLANTNCVILERMGTVGQLSSRLLSFGTRGSEFQFVEGKLPEGVTFHNKLTERDVRTLQATGSQVVVLDSDYLPTALMDARESCLKAAFRAAAPVRTTQVEIASSPAGSDIELDGKFVGSTPSLVRVSSGEHTVKLTKTGYAVWERTLTTLPGSVRIAPDLQPVTPVAASTEETTTSMATAASSKF